MDGNGGGKNTAAERERDYKVAVGGGFLIPYYDGADSKSVRTSVSTREGYLICGCAHVMNGSHQRYSDTSTLLLGIVHTHPLNSRHLG